jgi:putative transposase
LTSGGRLDAVPDFNDDKPGATLWTSLIAVPQLTDGLRRAIGEVRPRYTRMVNFREGWRGHLWQGQFASFVLDEPYLLTAGQYVELDPVRAGLIDAPSRYW